MFHTSRPSSADVFITAELARRPARFADPLEEKRALQEIAGCMSEAPETILPRFVDLAMRMTGGVSAGLSLLEDAPKPGMFRRHYVVGSLAILDGMATPPQDSPCSVALAERAPVLSRHPERLYAWIAATGVEMPEMLLVPLVVAGEPAGALWIVAGQSGHFDGGDARSTAELAGFVGNALHVLRTEERLRRALEAEATLAREMSHRLKNLFTLASTMIRLGSRSASDKDELARGLLNRLQALASAHQLLMAGGDAAPSDLGLLLDAVMAPFRPDGGLCITLDGPAVPLKPQAVAGLALIVNELATNAVKYGALASDAGRVSIVWGVEADRLLLTWTERGGQAVTAPPDRVGFGSRLLDCTIVRQFGGRFARHWRPAGLIVRVELPLAAVSPGH
ncbi:HWE histidine kinase domain-containing protein [Pleomorphomonas koreensis]|uniref:HWE histidine kinase domain-containing protein n=1 Tax=Pleomorphomonas koreensis TaxID=257440 RepID=UPI0004796B44|nr:HWE histidine kinase domain-containing protein [Pleomorphomonas koreensis]